MKYYQFFKSVSLWAGRISGFLIMGMIFATGFEVFSRYLFRLPTSWSNEVCTYLLLISAMLGVCYTQNTKGHIFVDWITSRLPLKVQRYLDLVGLFTGFVFWGLMCWQGILLSIKGWNWQSQSILEIPLIYPILSIPLGSLFMCLQIIADFHETVHHRD